MSNRGKLTAFIGAKGSGKTTLTNIICNTKPVSQRCAFAEPLRKMVEAIGITAHYHTDNKDEPIPFIPGSPTARHVLQTLGTEWGRDVINQNIWVGVAENHFQAVRSSGINVYVDDCRFPNEVELIKDLGGTVIKLMPGEYSNTEDEHESERHWRTMAYDHVLYNNGSPLDLYNEFLALSRD